MPGRNPEDKGGQPRPKPRDLPRYPGPGAQDVRTIPAELESVHQTAFDQQPQHQSAPRYWGGSTEGTGGITPEMHHNPSNNSYKNQSPPSHPSYRDIGEVRPAQGATDSDKGKGRERSPDEEASR